MSKKAIVSVINDLSTDQRVDRTCMTLVQQGYEVQLVGRILPKSLPLPQKPYATHRMRLFFKTGPFFYLEFQIRLFLFLIFKKADLLFSNDLDTLLPNYLYTKIRSADLVYDSHELFCEVPELLANPKKRKLWKSLEKYLFPKVKHVITVNQSIAHIYQEEYKKALFVVRNIPRSRATVQSKTKEELALPLDKKIIILQGAGINMERGAEELVEAMRYLSDIFLLIVGSGDVIEKLKNMRMDLGLEHCIRITGKVPFEQLAQYTRLADLGLSLDKDTNPNYRYSLPNKLFDYIQAGIPVLVSPLVEIAHIVNTYKIGMVFPSHKPKELAKSIQQSLNDKETYAQWKNNIKQAQKELNWETEQKQLLKCIAAADLTNR